jgi:hypothetical protein
MGDSVTILGRPEAGERGHEEMDVVGDEGWMSSKGGQVRLSVLGIPAGFHVYRSTITQFSHLHY